MSFSPKISIFAPNGSLFRTLLYTTLVTFCGSFYQAYAFSYTNTAADSFRVFIKKSYEKRGSSISSSNLMWLWSLTLNCLTIGNFLGTIFTPLLTDKMGRKFSLMIGNLGMLVASLIGAASILISNPELFILGRILGSAMTSTTFAAISLIMTECAATKLRGTCFFIAGTTFSAASVIGMVLGMNLFLGKNLFLLVGLEIDHEEIMNETLREEEDIRSDVSTLVLLKEMFIKPYLRRALFLGICSLQLILGVWTITTGLLNGHFSPEKSQLYSTMLFGVNFLAGIIGIFAITKIKRRKLMLISSSLNVAALFSYVLFDRMVFLISPTFIYGCLVSMFFYNFSYGIGIGTISFYITGELLPQLHRSVGQSVVFFFTLIISFFFSFLTLPAYEYYNVWAFIPLFTVPGCFCVLYIYLYLPETTNKEIHHIVEELKASTNSRETLNLASSNEVE